MVVLRWCDVVFRVATKLLFFYNFSFTTRQEPLVPHFTDGISVLRDIANSLFFSLSVFKNPSSSILPQSHWWYQGVLLIVLDTNNLSSFHNSVSQAIRNPKLFHTSSVRRPITSRPSTVLFLSNSFMLQLFLDNFILHCSWNDEKRRRNPELVWKGVIILYIWGLLTYSLGHSSFLSPSEVEESITGSSHSPKCTAISLGRLTSGIWAIARFTTWAYKVGFDTAGLATAGLASPGRVGLALGRASLSWGFCRPSRWTKPYHNTPRLFHASITAINPISRIFSTFVLVFQNQDVSFRRVYFWDLHRFH